MVASQESGRETEKRTGDERHGGGYGFPEAFHILERLEFIESFTFVEGKALGYRLSSACRRRPGSCGEGGEWSR